MFQLLIYNGWSALGLGFFKLGKSVLLGGKREPESSGEMEVSKEAKVITIILFFFFNKAQSEGGWYCLLGRKRSLASDFGFDHTWRGSSYTLHYVPSDSLK